MAVALQAGALAGGVVFVPMALAGWRLTRNRVLFFSAALFVVLAISVHLLPYFSTLSFALYTLHPPWPYLTVVNSVPPLRSPPVNCMAHLHELLWKESGSGSSIGREFDWSWSGSAAEVCRFEKLQPTDMVDLFRGTWIVVAGDSQLRFFFLSLLDLLMPKAANPTQSSPLQKHSSFEYFWEQENIKFQYFWTPFTANLTKLVVEYHAYLSYPDVFVAGGGLWHMLYITNSTHYAQRLTKLQRAIISLFPSSFSESQFSRRMGAWSVTRRVPHMFWLNLPTLHSSSLFTEDKREKMTTETCEQYDKALKESNLIRPGGPLTLIDLKKITRGCGHRCTLDGMHYNNATYEAAVHVMINALLIATQPPAP